MSEGPITIRCPYCGYPYPMSKMQLDVYIGRSMGCMHCGKSFPVSAPPPPPPPPDPLLAAGIALVQERDQTAIDAADDDAPSPVSHPPPVPGRPPPQSAAEPQSMLGWIAVISAILFMVLAAVAAIVGYSGSSENAIKAVSRSQLPLNLLRTALFVAAAGGVLGVIAMMNIRSRPREPGRRVRFGIAAPATIVCLAECVLASLLSLMVLPGLNRGLAETHRAACQTHLQMIGYALIATASERTDGKFPDSLGDLVSGGRLAANVAVCPAGPHSPAGNEHSKNEQGRLIADGKHTTYTYLGKGLAMRASGGTRVSTHTVLAYEPPGLHGGGASGDAEGFHVLFADGSVVFATKERAAKLYEELKSGQNPPPSAAGVKK